MILLRIYWLIVTHNKPPWRRESFPEALTHRFIGESQSRLPVTRECVCVCMLLLHTLISVLLLHTLISVSGVLVWLCLKRDQVFTAHTHPHTHPHTRHQTGSGFNQRLIDLIRKQCDPLSLCVCVCVCVHVCVCQCLTYQGVLSWETHSVLSMRGSLRPVSFHAVNSHTHTHTHTHPLCVMNVSSDNSLPYLEGFGSRSRPTNPAVRPLGQSRASHVLLRPAPLPHVRWSALPRLSDFIWAGFFVMLLYLLSPPMTTQLSVSAPFCFYFCLLH